MAYLDLFDQKGRLRQPPQAQIDALDEPTRARFETLRDAAIAKEHSEKMLVDAIAHVAKMVAALKLAQAEEIKLHPPRTALDEQRASAAQWRHDHLGTPL
jgi:hypothetical protein